MQLQNSEFTGPFQQYIASAAPFDVDVDEATMMPYWVLLLEERTK